MPTYNLAGNGSTPAQFMSNAARVSTDDLPEALIIATGTFGGGSLALEYSADGGSTWAAFTSADISGPFTAARAGQFNVHPGIQWRATLSGATAPNINVTLLS